MSTLGFLMAADDAALRAWVDLLAEEHQGPAPPPRPHAQPIRQPAPRPAARTPRLPALPSLLAGAALLGLAGLAVLAEAAATLRDGLRSQDPALLQPLVDWERYRGQLAAVAEGAEGEEARRYLRSLAGAVADELATPAGAAAYLERTVAPGLAPADLPRRGATGWQVVLGQSAEHPGALVVADLPPATEWPRRWRAVNLHVLHAQQDP